MESKFRNRTRDETRHRKFRLQTLNYQLSNLQPSPWCLNVFVVSHQRQSARMSGWNFPVRNSCQFVKTVSPFAPLPPVHPLPNPDPSVLILSSVVKTPLSATRVNTRNSCLPSQEFLFPCAFLFEI